MSAVKPGDVERTLRHLPPHIQLLLFYGPDTGRVSERAQAAAESGTSEHSGPLDLVRLDGEDIADRPGSLVEEATTYGLFGGRRVIWVRPTSRNIAGAVAPCLSEPLKDTLVVIEAGDLPRTSPLRTLCERSPLAYALPCFADEARELGSLVSRALDSENLQLEPDARDLLIESLGGDRLATRSELRKLALYCLGQESVRVQDIEAVVSDVSALSVDRVIDSAFNGDPKLEAVWAQHLSHGTSAATVLSAASRHTLALLGCRALVEDGESVEAALNSWRGLFFRRRSLVQRQVSRWGVRALTGVNKALLDGLELTRRMPALATPITGELLFRVAKYEAPRQAAPPRKDRHSASS